MLLRDSLERGKFRILRFFGGVTCLFGGTTTPPSAAASKTYLNDQNKVHVASGNLGQSRRLEPKAVDDLGSTSPLLLNYKWAGRSLVYFDCTGAEEHCLQYPHRTAQVFCYVYIHQRSATSIHFSFGRSLTSGRPGHPCLRLCPKNLYRGQTLPPFHPEIEVRLFHSPGSN